MLSLVGSIEKCTLISPFEIVDVTGKPECPKTEIMSRFLIKISAVNVVMPLAQAASAR